MKESNSNKKRLFIEIEMSNADNIISITKKFKSIGVEIDTAFSPKPMGASQLDNKSLFLIKARIVKSLIKQLNDCPDILNYWELN